MRLAPPVDTQRAFKNAPWRNEKLNERFAELYKLGFSHSIISERLSAEFCITVTRNSCIGRAARLNFEPRTTTHQSDGKISKRRPRQPPKPRAPKIVTFRRVIKCDPVELSKVNADALHLSLVDLERGQCHFPFGDGPFTFCGLKAYDGQSYCELHFALTHAETNGPSREKFRVSRFSAQISVAA